MSFYIYIYLHSRQVQISHMKSLNKIFVYNFTTVRVVHRPAVLASCGSFLEMQNLRL